MDFEPKMPLILQNIPAHVKIADLFTQAIGRGNTSWNSAVLEFLTYISRL